MGEMNIQKVMAAILESLTDAQKEQVKACKDTNELIAKLSEMGVALPDELLDAAVGGTNAVHRPMEGWVWGTTTCKRCGDPFAYQYYYNICLNVYGDNGSQEHDKPDYCPKCENPAEYVGR